jgi:hypothetical protein
MLRGGIDRKTTEEETEAQLILEEVLREGRGERDEIGEREGELFFKNVSLLLLILLSSLFLLINNSNQSLPFKKRMERTRWVASQRRYSFATSRKRDKNYN